MYQALPFGFWAFILFGKDFVFQDCKYIYDFFPSNTFIVSFLHLIFASAGFYFGLKSKRKICFMFSFVFFQIGPCAAGSEEPDLYLGTWISHGYLLGPFKSRQSLEVWRHQERQGYNPGRWLLGKFPALGQAGWRKKLGSEGSVLNP